MNTNASNDMNTQELGIPCPECGHRQWIMGPSGGMAENIRCGNDDCRRWYWWNGMSVDPEDLEYLRTEPTETELEKERIEHLRQRREYINRLRLQGEQACTANNVGLHEVGLGFDDDPSAWDSLNDDMQLLLGYLDGLRTRIVAVEQTLHALERKLEGYETSK